LPYHLLQALHDFKAIFFRTTTTRTTFWSLVATDENMA